MIQACLIEALSTRYFMLKKILFLLSLFILFGSCSGTRPATKYAHYGVVVYKFVSCPDSGFKFPELIEEAPSKIERDDSEQNSCSGYPLYKVYGDKPRPKFDPGQAHIGITRVKKDKSCLLLIANKIEITSKPHKRESAKYHVIHKYYADALAKLFFKGSDVAIEPAPVRYSDIGLEDDFFEWCRSKNKSANDDTE